jgi:probable phosphoglycerate mutase
MPASSAPAAGTDVLMLRHAPTRWNEEHRWQGWADPPLTFDGRVAAREWALRTRHRFAYVVASDLLRARDTALAIADALGHTGPVTEFPGLREQDQGEWTGLTKDEIKRRWPGRLRERPRWPVGGESPDRLRARIRDALGEIARAHPGRSVLAVTHSGVIRALEAWLGAPGPEVPHLEGRWFRLTASQRNDLGSAQIGGVLAGALTSGRIEPAAKVGVLAPVIAR